VNLCDQGEAAGAASIEHHFAECESMDKCPDRGGADVRSVRMANIHALQMRLRKYNVVTCLLSAWPEAATQGKASTRRPAIG
jgi:hypothetical protein